MAWEIKIFQAVTNQVKCFAFGSPARSCWSFSFKAPRNLIFLDHFTPQPLIEEWSLKKLCFKILHTPLWISNGLSWDVRVEVCAYFVVWQRSQMTCLKVSWCRTSTAAIIILKSCDVAQLSACIYQDMTDLRSYTHNLYSCVVEAWKKFGNFTTAKVVHNSNDYSCLHIFLCSSNIWSFIELYVCKAHVGMLSFEWLIWNWPKYFVLIALV